MQLFSRSLFRISALAATLAGAPALHATSVVNGFNVVTLGNFASSNSDLQRTLAMGQNLTLSGSVQQWHGVWQSISGKRHCDERGRLRGGVRDDGRRVSLGFFTASAFSLSPAIFVKYPAASYHTVCSFFPDSTILVLSAKGLTVRSPRTEISLSPGIGSSKLFSWHST